MTDIIELIRADHRHVMVWQAELGELVRHGTVPGHRSVLADTWNTLASLIDLRMAAEDEILGPAMRDVGTQELVHAAREAIDAHEDIREIIRETSLRPPGSPLWWPLATAALSAWAIEADRQERGVLPNFASRTVAAQRKRLCYWWRAFVEARIRDQIPDAPPHIATCQLRRTRPSSGVPRVAAIIFDPIYCTCPDCDEMLDRLLPVLLASPRHAPPSSASLGPHPRRPVPGPASGRVSVPDRRDDGTQRT